MPAEPPRSRDCDEAFSSSSLPPGALEGYDTDEYPELFERWTGSLMDVIQRGFCIACYGRIDPQIVREDDDGDSPTVRYDCRRCPEVAGTPLGAALLGHPEMVGFH